ncbi:MAG: hypothetical protein IJT60_03645 [Clostridia bacterium]|nr:hypothetical protein [Clostridia bacterium]
MPDIKKYFLSLRSGSDPEPGGENEGNLYYLRKAERWSRIRILLTVFILVFLISFTLFNIRELTLENFAYFFSDFRSSVQAASYEAIRMEYVADSKQSFGVFRGGLCVAGEHNVAVFTQQSRRLITDTVNLSDPVVASSDKYVMVYDRGSYGFYVYNSYSRILFEELDEPILYGAVSNRGDLAIVTFGTDNLSHVYVYNSSMELTARIRKNTYVTCVAFNGDSSLLALGCVEGRDGSFSLTLEAYGVSKGVSASPVFSRTYQNCYPLYLIFSGNKYLSAVCDTSMICLGSDGKEILNYHFSAPLVSACASPEGCAMAFSSDLVKNEVRLICVSGEGKIVHDGILSAGVEQILLTGGCVYLKGERITRFTLSDKKSVTDDRPVAGLYMLPASGGRLLLCSPALAEFYTFGDSGVS